MTSTKRPLGIPLLVAWALSLLSSVAQAQSDLNAVFSGNRASRASWEQRVLQRERSPVRVASRDQYTYTYRMARAGQASPGTNSALAVPPSPTGTTPPGQLLPSEPQPEVVPKGAEVLSNGTAITPMPMPGGVYAAAAGGCHHGDQCEGACDSCDGCDDCEEGWPNVGPRYIGIPADWLAHVAFSAGVQGFKGPTDLGRNGNFGFHEGVSLAGPLGDPWGFGYQLGLQGVHSNFRGTQPLEADQVDPDGRSRNQVFFTGGLFHRPECGGFQGGTAVDYFHDSYFEDFDLVQVRTEAAWVVPQWFEVGFWGAFGVNKDQITKHLQDPFAFLTPKDMYSVFYRRLFSGGGQGRLWLGLSGNNEVGCGGDIMVPLGTSWSLENNFTFLVPKRGTASGGQLDESWAVSMQLVWYPGRSSRCVRQSPYYPLFKVADNSVFLVGRR